MFTKNDISLYSTWNIENSCTVKWILIITLHKPIVRNLDFYDACCYIYICTVVYVSVIILCVMELLQIKFCIFKYWREATILLVEMSKSDSFSPKTL